MMRAAWAVPLIGNPVVLSVVARYGEVTGIPGWPGVINVAWWRI